MIDTKATLAEEEVGWVVERGDSSPSSPTYWSGPGYWSQDHMDAVRFARKQDAERVACRVHGGYHRICEHGWVNNPTPPAVEADDRTRAETLWKALKLARYEDGPDIIAKHLARIRREAAQGREKELTAALRKIAALDRYSGSSLRSRAASEIARAVLAKATERGL